MGWGQHCRRLGSWLPCSGPAGQDSPSLSPEAEGPVVRPMGMDMPPSLVCRKAGSATGQAGLPPCSLWTSGWPLGTSVSLTAPTSQTGGRHGACLYLGLCPHQLPVPPLPLGAPPAAPHPQHICSMPKVPGCMCPLRACPPTDSTQVPWARSQWMDGLDKVPFSRVDDGLQCSRCAWTTQVPVLQEWWSLLVMKIQLQQSHTAGFVPTGCQWA